MRTLPSWWTVLHQIFRGQILPITWHPTLAHASDYRLILRTLFRSTPLVPSAFDSLVVLNFDRDSCLIQSAANGALAVFFTIMSFSSCFQSKYLGRTALSPRLLPTRCEHIINILQHVLYSMYVRGRELFGLADKPRGRTIDVAGRC